MSEISGSDVKKLVVACEAGMGSSVMIAKQLARQLKDHSVSVTHSPVNQLADAHPDVVLCHRGLGARAKQAMPNTPVVVFDMFLGDPKIQGVVDAILNGENISDA
ncbi:MAG: PTS lactose transporter subunit IIB [Actinomycetota bacterium]